MGEKLPSNAWHYDLGCLSRCGHPQLFAASWLLLHALLSAWPCSRHCHARPFCRVPDSKGRLLNVSSYGDLLCTFDAVRRLYSQTLSAEIVRLPWLNCFI